MLVQIQIGMNDTLDTPNWNALRPGDVSFCTVAVCKNKTTKTRFVVEIHFKNGLKTIELHVISFLWFFSPSLPELSSSPWIIHPLSSVESMILNEYDIVEPVYGRSWQNTPGAFTPPAVPLQGLQYKNYFFLVAFFLVAFFFAAFFLAAIICPPPFGIPRSKSSGLILKQAEEHHSAVTSASTFPGSFRLPER